MSAEVEVVAWVGCKLDESGGRSAGRVEAVLVDSRSGEPAWLVIKVGRLRGHSAVPVQHAAGGIGHVWVPYTREELRSAPQVDPAGLSHEDELALCEHYGIPPAAGRRAALEGREDEAQTSRPIQPEG